MDKMDKIKKDIMIRGLQNSIWMKFRQFCKDDDMTANYAVKRLIRNAVKEYEAEHGEVKCNLKK